MKTIAIRPGTPDSVHLRELPRPSIDEIPDGRGERGRWPIGVSSTAAHR